MQDWVAGADGRVFACMPLPRPSLSLPLFHIEHPVLFVLVMLPITKVFVINCSPRALPPMPRPFTTPLTCDTHRAVVYSLSLGCTLPLFQRHPFTPPCPPQAVELKVTKVVHVGTCDAATYPMAKKKQSMEFLREKAHLRPRTNTIGAVARIRNALAFSTHK